MKAYILFAALAGLCWGLGGYFEKAGLKQMSLPPVVGITVRTATALLVLGLVSIPAWRTVTLQRDPSGWLMIFLGGGIVAGSLGMWSFYASLATTENLGVTLAIAFAMSPLCGTAFGLLRGDQPMNPRIALGLVAIVIGIVLIQSSHGTHTASKPPAESRTTSTTDS